MSDASPPVRGFLEAEYQNRTALAQSHMRKHGLSALLLTTEPEVRYYTGFLTRFWESPTRPWFLIVPSSGKPVAVIPSIGHNLMAQSWLDDIRTWDAPDYDDDGVSLLVDTLSSLCDPGSLVGMAHGRETHARMPLGSLDAVKAALQQRSIVHDHGITANLRMVKSDAEIAKISHCVDIASRAFDRVFEIATAGTPLSTVFRAFQSLCLNEGADAVSYLAGAAEHGGYGDVISPATDAPLTPGDVLMLDTGAVWDGYFCDFDRNYSVGPPSPAVTDAHARLVDATEVGLKAARPGATFADLHKAMSDVLGSRLNAGRLGHGLGMELTEGPSILPVDETVLQPGMVITLEPCIEMGGGKIMVHEENVVIEAQGPRFLSSPAPADIRVL
ncbi:MAG: Xaa-Pro peptidase family protein [Pseudomonadota bacterium]